MQKKTDVAWILDKFAPDFRWFPQQFSNIFPPFFPGLLGHFDAVARHGYQLRRHSRPRSHRFGRPRANAEGAWGPGSSERSMSGAFHGGTPKSSSPLRFSMIFPHNPSILGTSIYGNPHLCLCNMQLQ